MQENNIDIAFKAAFEAASEMKESLPPDVMLRIYAYYKQATNDANIFSNGHDFDLRNAFKMNAWMQISHLSKTEAKIKYIEIINEILKK